MQVQVYSSLFFAQHEYMYIKLNLQIKRYNIKVITIQYSIMHSSHSSVSFRL